LEVQENKEQLLNITCPITVENLIQTLQKSLKEEVIKKSDYVVIGSNQFPILLTAVASFQKVKLREDTKVKVGIMTFMDSGDFAPFITSGNEVIFFDKNK